MSGTTPRGVQGEREAAAWVRDMFGRVAPRYDLLNHLLSFNIDKLWRARTVRLLRPTGTVLDLCCGTGDLALALRKPGTARVFGSDFAHPMLVRASAKSKAIPFFEADALQLPVRDGAFDLVTLAFGFRNLANYEAGLLELRRVLKPGGTLAVLEFSTPPNRLFGALYNWYSTRVLPRIGAAISGAGEAYTYLPESVQRFPAAPEFAQMMTKAGLREVRFHRWTGGIVALHTGKR